MRVLIIYFSYTSCVAALAEVIARELSAAGAVTVRAIEPKKSRGYWGWLARSFIRGWRSPILPTTTDLAPYDLVCLGFPKWTFACPPVNEYLCLAQSARGKRFALFMSYGGFDEERYLQGMVQRIKRLGGIVVAAQKVRRRQIRQGEHTEILRQFCQQIRQACINSGAPG